MFGCLVVLGLDWIVWVVVLVVFWCGFVFVVVVVCVGFVMLLIDCYSFFWLAVYYIVVLLVWVDWVVCLVVVDFGVSCFGVVALWLVVWFGCCFGFVDRYY